MAGKELIFRVHLSWKGRDWAGIRETTSFSITARSEEEVVRDIGKVLKVNTVNPVKRKKGFFAFRLSPSLILYASIESCGGSKAILTGVRSWLDDYRRDRYDEAILSKFPMPEMGNPGNDLYYEDKGEFNKQCDSQRAVLCTNKEVRRRRVQKFHLSAAGLKCRKRFLIK